MRSGSESGVVDENVEAWISGGDFGGEAADRLQRGQVTVEVMKPIVARGSADFCKGGAALFRAAAEEKDHGA
jgi:hypothetical protein